MRKNIFLKSLVRQPFKSLLIFLLIGLVGFGFISKASEYIVINSEVQKASDFYRPVGTITVGNEDSPIPDEAVNLIAEYDGLDFMDIRRGFGGAMENIYSADYDGATEYNNTMFMYATYLGGVLSDGENTGGFTNPENPSTPFRYWYQAEFYVNKVLAGYPEHIQENEKIELSLYADDKKNIEAVLNHFEKDKEYLIRACLSDAFFNATPLLKPVDSENYAYTVQDGHTADLSAGLQKEIETCNENTHIAFLTTTKDMSMIPSMKSIYYLEDGRFLNREDDLNKNKVCVIRREMAERRQLSIGDKISMKIRETPTVYVSSDEDWKNADSFDETYEIVGIFGTTENEVITSWHSNIYVPDSTIPADFKADNEVFASSFSFVLKTPEAGLDFQEQVSPALEAMGCSVTFEDNGWQNFADTASAMLRSVLVSMIIFGLIFIAAAGFSVFFFIHFHKKEWLILNLLGTPKNHVSAHLIAAGSLLTAAGILIGGIASWFYTLSRIAVISESFAAPGSAAANEPPLVWLIFLCIGCFILWFIINFTAVYMLGRKSLIAASDNIKVKKHTGEHSKAIANNPPTETVRSAAEQKDLEIHEKQSADTKKISLSSSASYVLKHGRRTLLPAVITAVIICAFIFTLGWLKGAVHENESKINALYDSIPVKGSLIPADSTFTTNDGAFIPFSLVYDFQYTEFLSDFLLEAAIENDVAKYIDENDTNESLLWTTIVIKAIDRPEMFEDFINGNVSVNYAPGYSQDLFKYNVEEDERAYGAIISENLAASLNIGIGDNIRILTSSIQSEPLPVAGIFQTDTEMYSVLLSSSCFEWLFGQSDTKYSRAEFTLKTSENRSLDKVKETFEQIMEKYEGQTLIPLDYVIRDEELKQAIEPLEKNNTIIQVLYPIMCIVFALVCAVISLLFVIRASKEAAVLRILGTTKLRVGMMLAAERVLVCLISLILAAALTLLIIPYDTGTVSQSVLQNSAVCFISCIIASAAGALIVVGKKPLSLLQIKE